MILSLLQFFSYFLLISSSSSSSSKEYSVLCSNLNNSCFLSKGKLTNKQKNKELISNNLESHSYGIYIDNINQDGWGKLWLYSDSTLKGWYQAGFLEGSLTSERIYQHYTSWYNYQFSTNPLSNNTIEYLLKQYNYAIKLSKSNNNDQYYITLSKVLEQFKGILDGINYSAKENQTMTLIDLLLLQAAGDLYDIIPAVDENGFDLHIGKLSPLEFFDRWHSKVSCSAMIKITDDKKDVFAAHTTWTSYQNMLRIYKNYNLDDGNYKSSHSSKPGVIYSKDDFYVLPKHNLVVMETTNGVMNEELYSYVTTESLLTWQRLPLVNTLAKNGKEWVDIVSRHNSGTYANQWMVLDLKLFQSGIGVTSSTDFLWIVELAPGLAISEDVTQVMLSQGGYWPSYNVPYTKEMYKLSGFQAAYETYGNEYSYQDCTRAQIFKRNQSMIQSFDQMKKMLRYNDYLNDPLSGGNSALSISARYEFRSTNPKTYGGVDTKVTSFQRIVKDESGEDMKVSYLLLLLLMLILIFIVICIC